ncbi:hypothetical protein [Prochlorococcus marinus]|uniref:Uncharacterized protein n=1 Tax=Prochlorococcus marinus str. PAC1 TaxID=59924 RepID=A0A0A2C2N9_PROMR|nr:hypothetical protein [Prochlorococcus marinus]KGG20558.1 hypothetical protein EV03_1059 [Prochlorococcus marinus str. PAC1]
MTSSFRDQLTAGRRAMAHLVHVWHERNGWSHKVLPALAECLDLGRVHSSQISNLRNGKLVSPSPEVFFALGKVNQVLSRGLENIESQILNVHPELLRSLKESAIAVDGNDNNPLSAGDFFEIFVGLASLPSSFDWFIEEAEAPELSAALADYLCQGRSWRMCREQVMSAYPVSKKQRRERFEAVMAGLKDYTAEELDGELLDLHATNKLLNTTNLQGADDFLENLRQKGLLLKDQEKLEIIFSD